MKKLRLNVVQILVAALLWIPVSALSQGSLTPPGPPGPTMKTLTQVEPRTPIESIPFTISSPGSYYLTGNLTGTPVQDGIVIKTSGVSVDLKGFTIRGCASGIRADSASNPSSITVIGGIVTACSVAGVDLGAASKCHLEHLLICNNGGNGVNAGAGSIVTLCEVNLNQASGISVGDGSAVFNCVVQSNKTDGILLSAQCRAADNVCDANGSSVSQGGIHATGRANRIDSNNCNRNNSHGIKVDGTGNLVVRNSVCDSTGVDYDIAAGNNYGQILINPGAGFVNSNPWANFSCGVQVGQSCVQDSDCASLSGACNDGVCLAGQCGTRLKPDNTACPGGVCLGGVCGTAPSCVDGVKNGSESDVDCGGTCPKCADGRVCLVATDCVSGICSGGICRAASCMDGVKNGSESDIDCGGGDPMCPRCTNGRACLGNSDCVSGVCSGGICGTASCFDGVKDGTETDVDCGGTCATKCADSKACLTGNDCASGVCFGGICRTATCTDLVKNGTETDVDCGGTCPSKCAVGKLCGTGSDCTSGICAGGVCQSACPAGYSFCGNACIPTTNDPNNCGGCGIACPSGPNAVATCANNACGMTCNAGYVDCDGTMVNGCEVSINNDPSNCGGCGAVCSNNHMQTLSCSSGVCSGICQPGFADCDGNKRANGCEVSLNTDPFNCGSCGRVCSNNHMQSLSCSSGGVCNGICQAGYADCNGNKQADGCEINTTNDRNNCGYCGNTCSVFQSCINSTCQ